MKIALLISGEPRTIVFNEQICFFKKFISSIVDDGHSVHVYMLFKLRNEPSFICSREGLSNFMKLLEAIQPVSVQFTGDYEEEQRAPRYYSQIKMIDVLLEKASKFKYDFFLRVRPDSVIKGKINFSNFSCDTVYTSNKFDAVGNDQVFLFHSNLFYSWWIPIIRPTLDETMGQTITPEYVIFNKCRIYQVIESGLVVGFNQIKTWYSNSKQTFDIGDYWFDFESYKRLKISISNEEFINGYLEAVRIPV